MSFALNPTEMQTLAMVPDQELAAMAADLSLLPDEEIDRKAMVEAMIPRLLAVAKMEGLPFSKYDADDLEELPTHHREALAKAMGWSTSVRAMLRAGGKVYKIYRKERTNSQIPLMLPLMLPMLARYAAEAS